MTNLFSNKTPDIKNYQYRLIAYIDILGFKNIIKRKDINEILKSLKTFQEEGIKDSFYEGFVKNEHNLKDIPEEKKKEALDAVSKQDRQVSIFSDLIVISYSNHKEYIEWNIHEILDQIHWLQDRLIFHKILIRGGITFDRLFHNGRLCFGDGLIRAYELESKIATYPRVIIDPNILKYKTLKKLIDKWGHQLEIFEDKYLGLSHFKSLRDSVKYVGGYTIRDGYMKSNGDESAKFNVHIHMSLYRQIIDSGIKEGLEEYEENKDRGEKILIKYQWLAKQYKEVLTALKAVTTFDEKHYGKLELELENELIKTINRQTATL